MAVSQQQLESAIRQTIADGKVSRSERSVLKELLQDANASENELAYLRHAAFEIAASELITPTATDVVDWLEDIVKLLQPVAEPAGTTSNRVYFSPGDSCSSTIEGLFRRSRKNVDICVFTITDNRLAAAITDAHHRGVVIRVITDNDKAHDLGSDIDQLRHEGVPVRCDKTEHHMHHKFAIFDETKVLTGSYNWTRSAALRNQENILVSEDRRLATEFSDEFSRLWGKLK